MDKKTISTTGLTAGAIEPATSGTVNFRVKYPKGYEGDRFMPDDSIQPVSEDTAKHFESLGIGSIERASVASATDAKETTPLTAKELIAQINEAETVEAVDALISEDEERKTVLDAAEARIKALEG